MGIKCGKKPGLPPVLPPHDIKQPGRPKKQRTKDPTRICFSNNLNKLGRQGQDSIKCRRCGRHGHNKRTCKLCLFWVENLFSGKHFPEKAFFRIEFAFRRLA